MAFLGYTQKGTGSDSNVIGDLIQGLAQKKLAHQKYKQNEQFLSGLGLNKQLSSSLAHKDDKFIGDFLGQFEGFNLGNQAQYQQPPQALNQRMEGLNPQQSQQGYDQNQALEAQYNNQQQSPEIQNLVARAYADHPGLEQQVSPEQLGNMFSQQMQQQQQMQSSGTPNGGIISKKEGEAQRAARNEQLKQMHEQRKYERDKYDKEVKESKDWYKKELEGTHSLKENLARLNRMEALNKSGKISHNLTTSIRDTIAHGVGGKFGNSFIGIPGIDLTSVLLSEDSQEFEKLSKDMLSGLSDMYKGRVNQVEVEAFLKTIPSLMQSADGRQRVIENMRRFTEDKLLATKEAKKIKAEYGGTIPPDLQLQVEERIADRLDKTIEDFKNLSHTKATRNENLLTSVAKSIPRLIL